MTATRAAARGAGLVLMAIGALAIAVAVLGLLAPEGTSGVVGALAIAALGAALSGGGYLLLRAGARATGLGTGDWARSWFRRRSLVLIEVLIAAVAVGFAVVGYTVLGSGGDPSEVAIPVAFVPLAVAIIVTLEMNRRQAGTRAQYLVIVPGFVLFGVLLVVLGATPADLGQLAAWSVGPILIGLASQVSGRRG